MQRILLPLLIASVFFVSCNKEGEIFYDDSTPEEARSEVTRSQDGGSDPFAIDAMQRALDVLSADNPSLAGVTLQPTDYYVKFNPQDSVQMAALEEAGIELFNHPLDNGVYTETEPEDVTEDSPIIYEPLYSVVPADFRFPEGVDYEVIHGVFIQNNVLSASDENQLSEEAYKSVLSASLQLTGNASPTRSAIEEFQPSARLRFEITENSPYNLQSDTLPLVGAKVLAFYYTNVSWKITNDDGETGPICTTNTPVRYEVHWGGDFWSVHIANKNRKRISIVGDGFTGPLDTVFTNGTWEGVMAGMHTALRSYFYKDYPLTEELIKGRYTLKIASMTKGGRSSAAPIRPWREIYFYGRYNDGDPYHRPEVSMNTMFHELGHISHHSLEPWKYNFRALQKDGESWATGVEYAYMRSFFPQYTDPHDRGSSAWKYTRVVECLLKNGFSMGDIQHGFHESGNWESWKIEMRRVVQDRTGMSDAEKERMCNIVNLIFTHPNALAFDMGDLIVAGSENAFMNEPVRFSLIEDARDVTGEDRFVKIQGWEFPDSDTVVLSNRGDNVLVYFREGGMKTIRLNVTIDGIPFTSEKKLNVYGLDIIEFPKEPLVGYKTRFYLRKQLADAGVTVTEWGSGDSKTVREMSGPRVGHFTFKEKGIRKIKAKIHYPNLNETVFYDDIEVLVRDPDDTEIFCILDRPEILRCNTTYRAAYMPLGEKITAIEQIEFNHYSLLFYHDLTSWSFDPGKGVLTFSIPEFNVSIDYIVAIFYRVKDSDELKMAKLFFSNYR